MPKAASAPPAQAVEPTTEASLRARFGELAEPAVHLREGYAGFSRLGGLPHLPAEAVWPSWNGKPQAFLAQIDLAEIHAVQPSFLPASGVLYFFYDQEQSAWGSDPEDRGAWKVIYSTAERASLRERAAPTGALLYKAKRLNPVPLEVLPSSERLPRSDFDCDCDEDVYTGMRDSVFDGETRHQMLGFPTPVQDDEMEMECLIASRDGGIGAHENSEHSRRAALKAAGSEWKLLLQLDTDDDTGWMWGDVGTIYYWVRESDARAGDFSKVWMIFQCC